MKKESYKEVLLHYVWKTKQFDHTKLYTTEGKEVTIHTWGIANNNSGPDFFNGKIEIENTIWAGSIEMHVLSSDWLKHSHNKDTAYDNVILHVVYKEDKPIFHKNIRVPCIEIGNRIPKNIKNNYENLIKNKAEIPCHNLIFKVDSLTTSMWKHNLIAERLEEKAARVDKILIKNDNDWDQTMYTVLSRYMGSTVNMEPFESLSTNLPIKILQKNRDNLTKIEALLFGAAGMLNEDLDDQYYRILRNEYSFLSKKYNLPQLNKAMWRFSKMRPSGFPTIRIAQLARIIYDHPHMFSHSVEQPELKKLRIKFTGVASEYWTSHYTFGKKSKNKVAKRMTEQFIDRILINVVSPIIFLYGLKYNNHGHQERAIFILESIKSEKNRIISMWQDLGIESNTALDSQALLQLKKNYCNKKRCLSCNIGNKIVHSN